MPGSGFLAALRVLRDEGVDFIVVGGVAAVLNGAPINTFDLDIVPLRDEVNGAKLLTALSQIGAIYRLQPARQLRPTLTHLASSGHQQLITNHGPLDVLGTIGRNMSYGDLLPHTVEMDLGQGLSVRVLDLQTIIALKEELAQEKDLAVLPVLRRTLQQQ
jgi:predicted nucleotidyltransferase